MYVCMQEMHACMYVCVRMYVSMYVCMYVHTYVCMYVRTYVCMYVCMYVGIMYTKTPPHLSIASLNAPILVSVKSTIKTGPASRKRGSGNPPSLEHRG